MPLSPRAPTTPGVEGALHLGNPFFELSWLALQKARARSLCNDDDRAQISQPPLLWLAPQSDHGSAACAETEAFFQHGPLQSFFKFNSTGSPCNRHVRGKLAQRLTTGHFSPPSYGSLRSPITGVPRSRKRPAAI